MGDKDEARCIGFPPELQEITGSLYDHDHDRFDMIQALAKQLTSALMS
jgi:hypothetical protein